MKLGLEHEDREFEQTEEPRQAVAPPRKSLACSPLAVRLHSPPLRVAPRTVSRTQRVFDVRSRGVVAAKFRSSD